MPTTAEPAKRSDVPFTWAASCGMPAFATLAGVRFDRLFTDVEAIVAAYTKGRPMAEALFGPDVAMGGPTWVGISYGHINTLGARLVFPEDSEVGHVPVYRSLREGISALQRETDFIGEGLFPFYLELWEKLKQAFPDDRIPFGDFKSQGPVTTAWLLRGHDFFMDSLDDASATRAYLELVTASIIRFNRLVRRINGQPEFSEKGMGMVDDGAAMIGPDQWPDMVLPFLERYYQGQTCGRRSAHIEDLKVGHLKYLDQLGLSSYDPSVSPKLTPELIRDHCAVPFLWRLNSTHYVGRSLEAVEEWVFEAAAGGASGVFTVVAREMCDEGNAGKVRAFVRAARRVKELLDGGCPRAELALRR